MIKNMKLVGSMLLKIKLGKERTVSSLEPLEAVNTPMLIKIQRQVIPGGHS